MKKYTPTSLFSYYLNIVIFYLDFSLDKNRKQEQLSKVHTRYKKTVEKWRDIENDFYANTSPKFRE